MLQYYYSHNYSGMTNYYTHFVFVTCIKSHNVDNTHIKIFHSEYDEKRLNYA